MTASACGQRSVVHSLPQLVVVWNYCGWRKKAVEQMFDIVVYLVKQLIVDVFEQLIKRRQVWRTKSTALATANKRVDSLSVCCRNEAAPRRGQLQTGIQPVGQRHTSHDFIETEGRIASESSR